MIAKRSTATCIIAVFAVLAALIATPFIQTAAAQAATTPNYGAGAYTGSNPIGGGNGYVSAHRYSQASADYVVTTWAQLKSACSSATSGDVIWVPSGVTLRMASADDHPTLKPGVVLASNRGQNGATGGKLKQPYISSGSSNYMSPIIYASSNCVISGLVFEGPGSFASTSNPYTNAAIRIDNAKRVEIENCDIGRFYQGGIYIRGGMPSPWNSDSSTGRHYIHHCSIHDIQRHGFGYGIQVEGNGSFLCEASNLYNCRHEICASQTSAGGYGNCYEVRYCNIGDGWYGVSGNPSNPSQQHSVDVHGFGASTSGYAGGYIWIHHNTFTSNNSYGWGKPNVGIRGIPHYECRVYNNWTKKTTRSGVCSESSPNSAFTLLSSGGTTWNGGSSMSSYKMYVYDNWYGTTAPSGSSFSTNSGSTSTSSTSSTSTSITTKPAAPTLVSPASGGTVSGSSVTFRWKASTGAVKYWLVVSTSSSLTTTQSHTSVRKVWQSLGNVTEYTATGFDSGKSYYWWVFSGNSYGWSSQTQVLENGGWRFVYSGSSTPTNTTPTSTAVSAPTLVAPANGAVTWDHTPYLDWSQVTAASTVHYQVQVDNNSDFSSPVVSKTWVSYSYYYVTTYLSHTTYYWRVRAVDATGRTSAWTSARSFRVA